MLAVDLEARKKNTRLYNQTLIDAGKSHVADDLFDDHSFLKYPLLVKNRDKFMALAEKSRVLLGEWFLTPLHPVKGDLSAWGYEYGSTLWRATLARYDRTLRDGYMSIGAAGLLNNPILECRHCI